MKNIKKQETNKYIGMKGTDIVTGFTGTITGSSQHITGCDQYCLVAKSVKNEAGKAIWFDSNRISVEKYEKKQEKLVLDIDEGTGCMENPEAR